MLVEKMRWGFNSVLSKDFGKELLQSLIFRVCKELFGCIFFLDYTIVDEQNPVCHLACKSHLMRDDHHCHPFISKLFHEI